MNHSIRNWLYPLLSVIAVVAVLLSLAHYKTKAHDYEECSRSAHIAALNDLELNTAIDPEYKPKKTEQNRQDIASQIDCSDLSAQWAMSDIAMLGYIAGLLGLVFLGVTVYETKSAADLTRQALKETKTNSIRELRAYLGVHVMAKNFHDTRRIPTICIRFHNRGVSPAINISCHIIGMGADEIIENGATIQPDDMREIEWPLEDIKMNNKDGEEYFKIRIDYSDIFDGKRFVNAGFYVTSESFPMTTSIQNPAFTGGGGNNSIANPMHVTERKIQFRSYKDDLQKEAEEYAEANKAS